VSLVNPGPLQSLDGANVSLQLQGHDADGDTVTYTASGLPSGLSINNSTGLISGTLASNADTNSPYSVTLTASDGVNTTTQTFLWTVSQVALTAPGDQTNTEGDNVSLQLQGMASSGSLTYSASGLPAGLSLNSTTGLITGSIVPGDAANGPYTVDVSATNGVVSTSQTFTWTVNPVVNLTAPADQNNNEGDSVSLQMTATDSLNNTLTYSAVGLPSGLSINSTTGLITGTIASGDASGGPFSTTVTASDGTYSSTATFNWNVTDKTALTMTAPGTQTNVSADSVFVPVSASDPDGDALTYSATNLPDGLSIDPVSGIISGIVADDAATPTPYQVTVTASDGNGQTISQNFNWIVNSPVIAAQAVPISAVEGVDPGSLTVATFTTPDLNSQAGDFMALINWGDGTTDTGAIGGSNGSFTVSDDHVYAEPGSYAVTVQIADSQTGGSAMVSTTAAATDAPLKVTGGFDLGVLQQQSPALTLATFTDANANASIADYTATITWGDGTGTMPATVVDSGDGVFSVVGSHAYMQNGAYTATITVTDVDGATATATSTVTVGNLIAGIASNLTVASFQDSNSNVQASQFAATIHWGDGSQSSGTVVGSYGVFSVQGTHTYAVDSIDNPGGVYAVSVTVSDPSGNTLTSNGTVEVVRPQLSLTVANVNIGSSLALSNVQVAAFTDPNASDAASEFMAQIDWGDGTPLDNSAVIQEVSPGLFAVLGSHTYSADDWYTMTVTISQGWSTKEEAVKAPALVGDTPKIKFYAWVPSGVSGGDPVYQSINNLAVGKWASAFLNASQNPTLRKNFISSDPARFWVQVKDPVAFNDPTVKTINVYIESSSDIGHSITLKKSTQRGWFGGELVGVGGTTSFSQPLLLTTFSADKTAGGTQTLNVKLGNTVRAIYGEGAKTEEATATVPIKKEVHLNINILNKTKGGAPVATKAEVKGDVWIANRIYAAAGIHLVINKIQYVNPPAKLGNLSAGLPTHFTGGKDTVSKIGLTKQEIALLSDKNLWPPTNVNGTKQAISVYYVNYFVDAMGKEIPTGYGESFPRKLVTNIQYADSIIVSAKYEQYQTLAHEIGHILENSGEHSDSKVNLMYGGVPPLVNNTPPATDSRRISATQAVHMLNNRPNLLSAPSS
jgi:hypothetical protein